MIFLAELEAQIETALAADRSKLRHALSRICHAMEQGKPQDKNLARLEQQLAESARLRELKVQRLPHPTYDSSLPIVAHKEEIQAAIEANSVVIVCGDTGSGKSTQLPKFCLEMGRGVDGLIGHTQPRRLAARSVASRVAKELDVQLGQEVGYKIRFTDQSKAETFVKLMTDGVMLAESQHDRDLEQYDTIIVDEAHERSLNIDFLLGYLRRLVTRRSDLRVVITSATIDATRFAEHFGTEESPAPVVNVAGRTFPVEVRYRPLEEDDSDFASDPDVNQGIATAVKELLKEPAGDMLVFLPTERDIREATRVLRGRFQSDSRSLEILPLYARLSNKDQDRIFQEHQGRRIVLATNVAESSLTVPGIRYVIDTGTARVSRYSPRGQIQRLPIEPVSKASADQRKGRCGRVAPGICIRLFSEEDYESRDQFAQPEIRRANLAAVILQTKNLNIGEIDTFPFLDPPRPEAIRDGYKTLYELGAIDEADDLTSIGRKMARLPVDPRIARIILAADEQHCLHEILIIAAALEIQDPRERPVDQRSAADTAHAEFTDEKSDFLTWLKLWDVFHEMKAKHSRNQLRAACRRKFLNSNRMQEWLDVYRQLRELVTDVPTTATPAMRLKGKSSRPARRSRVGLKIYPRRDDPGAIHRALLTGFVTNIARITDKYAYEGAGGSHFYLWPGSAAFESKPKWILAAELVETTRRYMRMVAPIKSHWVEPAAEHLVKRTIFDSHWSRKHGSPMIWERVSLQGLILVPKRRIPFGPIDAAEAREIFILYGLVRGDVNREPAFVQQNRELIAEFSKRVAKMRSRELEIEEDVQLDFYRKVLPPDVYDEQRLHNFLKSAGNEKLASLVMTEEGLLADNRKLFDEKAYPDEVPVASMNLPAEYQFVPGDEKDGVTLTVPREGLAGLSEDRLGWLVPGLLAEKITFMIRSLPKHIRTALIPAPQVARQAADLMDFGEGPFLPSVAAALEQVSGEHVPVDAFNLSDLPQHLQFLITVVDADGKTLSASRSLSTLRRKLLKGKEQQQTGTSAVQDKQWQKEGLTTWTIGELPEEVEIKRGGIALKAYPGLTDQQNSVNLQLFDDPASQQRNHRTGTRRLYSLAHRRALRGQVAWLPELETITLQATAVLTADELKEQLILLIADRAFLGEERPVRDETDFNWRSTDSADRMARGVVDVAKLLPPLFAGFHRVQLLLDDVNVSAWEYAADDAFEQTKNLMSEDFLLQTPWEWLQHYPRYFKAIEVRFEKLGSGGLPKDKSATTEIAELSNRHQTRAADLASRGIVCPELETFRWMLEEYRVSCFAQKLGTSQTVSAKRLEKQWGKVRA